MLFPQLAALAQDTDLRPPTPASDARILDTATPPGAVLPTEPPTPVLTEPPAAEPLPEPTLAPPPVPVPPPAAALPTPVAAPTPTPLPAPPPDVPVLPRTPPRDTTELVALLEPLTEWGLPLEQVLLEGMGRFPVAGRRAHYSDDWLAARHTPTFHLHEGLDIFGAYGAPVRAPTAGVVTRFSDGYPGGTAVWMRGHDDTTYYFAHLMARAQDLRVGQSVETGTLLGYVGDTGNAKGTSPHVHLEIHRGGVAIPPKPIVDGWLDEAEAAAGDFIEGRRLQIELERRAAAVESGAWPDVDEILLRMILEPVGGSASLVDLIGQPAS